MTDRPIPAAKAVTNRGVIEAPLLTLIRTAYDGLRSSPSILCTEDLTRQGDAAECDIRHIMKRYEQTGVLPVGRDLAEARYVDNASAPTFEQVGQTVAEMRGWFSELPEYLRQRFGSAEGVVDAMAAAQGDTPEAEGLREELYRLGVLERPEADLTGSESRGRNAGHSAQLDKAVPTDGGSHEAEEDGTVSESERVPEKRATRTSSERASHADARRNQAVK